MKKEVEIGTRALKVFLALASAGILRSSTGEFSPQSLPEKFSLVQSINEINLLDPKMKPVPGDVCAFWCSPYPAPPGSPRGPYELFIGFYQTDENGGLFCACCQPAYDECEHPSPPTYFSR